MISWEGFQKHLETHLHYYVVKLVLGCCGRGVYGFSIKLHIQLRLSEMGQ